MTAPTKPAARGATVAQAALKATIPVLLGYVTIGMAFGLLLVEAGFPWWLAPLMSVVVYAGAAQFMAIGLLAAGTGILEMAILTLAINARHMVYGLSLLDRYRGAGRGKPYLVYALTDETYGILTTVRPPAGSSPAEERAFLTWVSGLDQSYWVAGSALGALAGKLITLDTRGLDFALTSLFVVLLVEQVRAVRRFEPYLVALASAVLAWILVGPANLLIAAMLLSIGGLLALRGRLA